MEYHAARFPDASLLVRTDAGKLVGLLPASSASDEVGSHPGLTYGGLITDQWMTTARILEALSAVAEHLAAAGYSRLVYKTVPHIYHLFPAEEDRYALFRLGARLTRRDLLLVVDYRRRLDYQERRRRSLRKAQDLGLVVEPSEDLASFWAILERNLSERHGVAPVHSLEEIAVLRSRFPDQIVLYLAQRGDQPLAGVVVFRTPTVCHLQYISASPEGRSVGALDIVIDHLLEEYAGVVRYFDFGAATEDEGRRLNEGLADQKEGFGARAVVHDHYELALGG